MVCLYECVWVSSLEKMMEEDSLVVGTPQAREERNKKLLVFCGDTSCFLSEEDVGGEDFRLWFEPKRESFGSSVFVGENCERSHHPKRLTPVWYQYH